ncbi:MAG: hypothetical protein LBU11_00235 [Zoogloeaceae bacterium]|jgi:hypothetical protein|nr:hypothetical protein [Zoogloeaceae bacterium]
MKIEQSVGLIGKSERDERVKAMLTAFDVKQPIKRPKRGESDVHIELRKFAMELKFALAESLGERASGFLEGELILANVFYFPNHKNSGRDDALPLGVHLQIGRAEQWKRFGLRKAAASWSKTTSGSSMAWKSSSVMKMTKKP